MREMDWYFAQTQYAIMRERIRNRIIDDARGRERNYGFGDYYDNWVDIDPVQLSEEAKDVALRAWARQNRDSDLSHVPESLHQAIRDEWAAVA